jgi:hypothetical protein
MCARDHAIAIGRLAAERSSAAETMNPEQFNRSKDMLPNSLPRKSLTRTYLKIV